MKGLWASEPVLITLLGSAAFWPVLFMLLSSFGHPLTQSQQEAITAFGVLVAGLIIRQQVVPSSGATLPVGTVITSPAVEAKTAVVGPDNSAPFTAVQHTNEVVSTVKEEKK